MAAPHAALAITQALRGARAPRGGALWAPILEELPLFSGVPKRHLRSIAALTRESRYRPGSAIVREGRRADDFFVLLEGEASILRSGHPPISIGPGSYFGEMALLDGGPRSATIVAETEVHCLRLPRAPFLRMVRERPEIALALLRELARRVRELQEARALVS
ncbi:MAG TPA: cyclic nucleotide-binding domain-containing protein [Sandaracinaceae bacterium]